MSLPDRSYWRDPEYWRWWWRERLSSGDKLLLALAAAVFALIGGIITADWISYDDTSETLTVPVISTVGASRSGVSSKAGDGAPLTPPASPAPARVVTEVLTSLETTTSPPETEVVTVRRNGRTRVVPKVVATPGRTVTHRVSVPGPVRERVVTSERVDTVVRTETQVQTQTRTTDRLVTVTSPAATETVSRTVTQPSPTVTQTNVVTVREPAQVVTVTRPVTVTNEVTVTVTETVKK
jgi:hypothetical protein